MTPEPALLMLHAITNRNIPLIRSLFAHAIITDSNPVFRRPDELLLLVQFQLSLDSTVINTGHLTENNAPYITTTALLHSTANNGAIIDTHLEFTQESAGKLYITLHTNIRTLAKAISESNNILWRLLGYVEPELSLRERIISRLRSYQQSA